ncbi:MAG: phosphoribosylglycinamide formyltransferase [Lysobacterales bacterium 69-70]|nr:phosphoribosylglycinamide formyltransferase [Xanthomonadaceae bacterium]ODU36109.1 MAG: phosphoribosylglycinamide formyltransferase [Xanthomonadaceae bacterium SCN 69-320]ODV18147.1 MAG: phosphoribosylglycinamide formyltransferase [Xanthomonadaceae bacterium SCN 69-25]OJY99431.1 MAG: phosphoribosylglycinamide formyltransferase [Xanthomonadales bacterium 69-70]
MRPPLRVAVLVSGRGSNLQALIAAQRSGTLPIEIVVVASDKPAAEGLRHARDAGIATVALDAAGRRDRAAFDAELFAKIAAFAPDLVVLAGFMRVLDAAVLTPWTGRIINIHPSLLPKYPGLHTHRRALQAGDAVHGASVHFVTAELDGGPVLACSEIAIEAGDDDAALAARLLPREHALLCRCVQWIAQGRITWQDGQLQVDGEPLTTPLHV